MPTPPELDRLHAVVPYAQATMRKWHVPASVTLAQWIFESTWGTSGLCVQANNCFGIKHVQADVSQPYMEFRTKEFIGGHALMEMQPFVKYASVAESFDDHGRLLGSTERYARAIAQVDVPSFCRALQSCGYSTDPQYAKKLCDEIAALNLTQYDRFPAADVPAKANA